MSRWVVVGILLLVLAPATWGADAVVMLKSGGLDFSPKKVVVRSGERVTWKNPTREVHSVTSFSTESGATRERPEIDRLVKPGEEFSHRFSTAGTFFYYCPIHQGMWGTVVVEK